MNSPHPLTYVHVTIEANIPSIARNGLQAKFSQGEPRNWFCFFEDMDFAAWHTYLIHGARPTYWVVMWTTNESLLKHYNRYMDSFMWYSYLDVDPIELEFVRLGERIGPGLFPGAAKTSSYGTTRFAEKEPHDLQAALAAHALLRYEASLAAVKPTAWRNEYEGTFV